MRNPFSHLFRARDKPGRWQTPQDAVSAAPTFSFGSSMSGKSVTPSSAIPGIGGLRLRASHRRDHRQPAAARV